jgi:hypothetical protein
MLRRVFAFMAWNQAFGFTLASELAEPRSWWLSGSDQRTSPAP